MGADLAVPTGGAYQALTAANTPTERAEAGAYACDLVRVPEMDKPVPRFFLDLPWADDSEVSAMDIVSRLAAADDIDDATHQKPLRKASETLGMLVTVLGVQARETELEDSEWGAALALTVSVNGGQPELMFIGSPEVCVIVWRRYMEGRMPFSGEFVLRGRARKGRNQPLGFEIEDVF